VLDQLTRALSAVAPWGGFSVIPLHNPRRGADAQVFLRDLDPTRPEQGADAGTLAAAREALAALPEVAAVGTRADGLTVRFADARVAAQGERMESGEAGALDMRELLAGTETVVNFCDANPTKALHIGHLRNIALGQALAGALAAAGARVTRQSQVSDYCRSMGEALAGYRELPAHVTPRTLGVKSDHFVGECFARYAGTPADRPPQDGAADPARGAAAAEEADAAEEPALSAEAAVRHDLAEELLGRLQAGDPEIVERWHRLRAWALEGQDETLAALGVKLDRMVHESDSRHLTRWIVDTGLAGGVLTRTASGAVVYETHDAEHPRLLLARADGFPTQHLRTFALWRSLRDSLDGARSIELVGEEWYAYVHYHERLMRALEPTPAPALAPQRADPPGTEPARQNGIGPAPAPWHPTSNVIYGMVTLEGGAVKSSNGRPPLVDGLLERLAASDELRELAARGEGRFEPRRLAALIALGFYLGRPTRKPVDLTLTEMLDLRGGIGWELARAAVHAWSPRYDGPPDPAPEDARYRQTVLQSEVHRQLLARAVERYDVYELARFYGHLSRRYLTSDAGAGRTGDARRRRASTGFGGANGDARTPDGDARVARAMRSLLAAGLDALGLPGAPAEGAPR
jgi:arginyl-tRNA synthetase